MPPAKSVMLKEEDLGSIKALSSIQPSPALLRELRKALALKKTAKPAACSKARTSCVALMKYHANISGAQSAVHSSSREASQAIAGKSKAEELSSPDGPSVPANRRPAPDPLVGVRDARHFQRTDCREQPAHQ